MSAGARAPRRIEVTAHAKLNLGLVIGPSRADGFHDLVTVFQSVSLADTLLAERTAGGFALRVRHENAAIHGGPGAREPGAVPAGSSNLVLRAARLAKSRLGLPGGARFTLLKRIPARAGMGGGSADAAAALAAMFALHGARPSRAERLALAAELGSDVPFALTGGLALGLGRGEVLRRLRGGGPMRAIVAVPSWRISTPEAFAEFDSGKYGLTRWKSALRFAASLGRKRVTRFEAMRLGNSFERVLKQHRRDFRSLCARLRASGLLEPRLTGSGSGVFGIVPDGASVLEISGRFAGGESLYSVRSVDRGLRLRKHA